MTNVLFVGKKWKQKGARHAHLFASIFYAFSLSLLSFRTHEGRYERGKMGEESPESWDNDAIVLWKKSIYTEIESYCIPSVLLRGSVRNIFARFVNPLLRHLFLRRFGNRVTQPVKRVKPAQ